jgi:hypothetical protein
MKNVETRRKLNNLKKALLIAGLATGITACAKTGSNEKSTLTTIEQPSKREKELKELNRLYEEAMKEYEELESGVHIVCDYIYRVPTGYTLEQDENGEYIGVAYINGERVTVEAQKFLEVRYVVPEGYTLGKDSEGNYIAIKDSVSENDKEEKQKIR